MHDLADGFRLRQPISVWNRPLKADFRQLFIALAKTASQGYSGNWEKAALAAADATKAVGVKEQRPEARARLNSRTSFDQTIGDPASASEKVLKKIREGRQQDS